MLEFCFHGNKAIPSLKYVVGYYKTETDQEIGMGRLLGVPTLRFLGTTLTLNWTSKGRYPLTPNLSQNLMIFHHFRPNPIL